MLAKYLVAALMIFTFKAQAEIKTEVIDYQQGDTKLQGYLAYDTNLSGKRPGILIVHDWSGMGEYVKQRAREMAGKGYVAFAADIYGKDVHPTTPDEMGKLAGKYKADRKLLRERAKAGYEVIAKNKSVDSKKIVAIGYCFGGTTVLEMGRAGLPLAGIASFHGGLANPSPQDAKNIKAKVLVMHGALDTFVSPEEVAAFQKEMNEAGIDYQFISYSGAVHAFTIPTAGSNIKSGIAYNAAADRRSMQAFMDFMKEVAPN